jgi:diguanylate cyclase (GGDEF)-like protein
MRRRTPSSSSSETLGTPSKDPAKPRAHTARRQPTLRQVLPFRHGSFRSKESLESVLGTVFRSEDNELDQILRALDDLAEVVKSQHVNSAKVNDALQRAAIWAVEKSLLDREIRSLAITDDLTGFFNRRGFLAAASQQLKLAQRDRESVLLLFCDVDSLKTINDSFGHREGDLALIRTADALEETFRGSDTLARLSGDEFAVLAWEASVPNLRAMLARLVKNLETANAEEKRYQLSLSVGVARYDPQVPLPLGELMANADQDMYKNKRFRTAAASSNK